MEAFPAALRDLRQARHLSQEAAAADCGLSGAHLSRLESAQRAATPPVLAALAAGLRLTTAEADRLWVAAGRIPPGLDPARVQRALARARARTTAGARPPADTPQEGSCGP